MLEENAWEIIVQASHSLSQSPLQASWHFETSQAAKKRGPAGRNVYTLKQSSQKQFASEGAAFAWLIWAL